MSEPGGVTRGDSARGARVLPTPSNVPTTAGPPSIVIPLWVQDSAGRFRTQSGSMRFLYGYVRASDGVRRFGWIAQDAVEISAGCS